MLGANVEAGRGGSFGTTSHYASLTLIKLGTGKDKQGLCTHADMSEYKFDHTTYWNCGRVHFRWQ